MKECEENESSEEVVIPQREPSAFMWEKLRAAYMRNPCSLEELAEDRRVPLNLLKERANLEGWLKFDEKIRLLQKKSSLPMPTKPIGAFLSQHYPQSTKEERVRHSAYLYKLLYKAFEKQLRSFESRADNLLPAKIRDIEVRTLELLAKTLERLLSLEGELYEDGSGTTDEERELLELRQELARRLSHITP